MDLPVSRSRSNAVHEPLARELARMIEMVGRHSNPEFAYSCMYDLVHKEGEWFAPSKLPTRISPGEPRQCFANAARLALDHDDLTYVEGYGMVEDIPMVMAHAWCVDRMGKVVDPTWLEDDGYARAAGYVGLRVRDVDLRAMLLARGSYGLLEDPMVMRHALTQTWDRHCWQTLARTLS